MIITKRTKRICYALRTIAIMLEEGTMEECNIFEVLREYLTPDDKDDEDVDSISTHSTNPRHEP